MENEQLKNSFDSFKVLREQLDGALPRIKETIENMKNQQIPQDKKDCVIGGKNIVATTHVGGLVTLHFATEKDKQDFFDSLTK